MNLSHLRKQAKNLSKHYPLLVATHAHELPLSGAQNVIAKINGFPSWEALVSSTTNRTTVARPGTAPAPLSDLLFFDLSKEAELPHTWRDGDIVRYKRGREATLKAKSAVLRNQIRREDDLLTDELIDYADMGGYDFIPQKERGRLSRLIEESLRRCPANIEAYARLAGIHFANANYVQALAVVEPIAKQLNAMIPSEGYIQVPYSFLENRPYHRLMQNFVLSLGKVGRDTEANREAKRMVRLHPNDNIGFRFLTSKASREHDD